MAAPEDHETPAALLIQPTHTVVSGDTLSGIAQTHGVELADLLTWNALSNPDSIQAERFGKRWIDLAAANRLDDINLIKVGQKLIIPALGVGRGR